MKKAEGVGARLETYIIALLWLPKANVLRGQADNIAIVVNNAGTRAPCPHVNANIIARLDLHGGKKARGMITVRS